ncbi:MAG TPA: outer membrane protein transport protein [candidate division Zixibacteria bacterium]
MKRGFISLGVILFILIPTSFAFAGGGFALPGVGSKALSMGGAFRGLADDWSAAYWNPAGLAYLPNSEFNSCGYILNFRPEYTPYMNLGDAGYDIGYPTMTYYPEDRAFFLPSFSGFYKFTQMQGFTGGIAFYAPYKLQSRWDLYKPILGFDNTVPYPTFDQSTNILIWDVHPSVAKTFMEDKLGLGLGISIERADFELRRLVLVPTDYPRPYDFFPVDESIITDGWGMGFNAGILYKYSPKLQFGLSYRSPVNIDLSGSMMLEIYYPNIPLTNSQIMGGTTRYKDGNFETTLSLPGEIGFGVMYKPLEKLTLTSDLSSVNWSRLESIDTKDFTLTQSQSDTLYLGLRDAKIPFNWKNIIRFSLGGEYMLKEKLAVRGGYFFEKSPIPNSTFNLLIPDVGDKNSINVGLSYRINSIELGYDYQLVLYKKRDFKDLHDVNGDSRYDNMPGNYKMIYHCSGLSFTYHF